MGRKNRNAMGSTLPQQHPHSNRNLYLLCAYLITFILLSIFGGCQTNRTQNDLQSANELTLDNPVVHVTDAKATYIKSLT